MTHARGLERTRARTFDTEILHLAHQEPRQKARGDERPHRLGDLCEGEGRRSGFGRCGRRRGETCGSGPLAETEEAHCE